jgi:hypothetical protein
VAVLNVEVDEVVVYLVKVDVEYEVVVVVMVRANMVS